MRPRIGILLLGTTPMSIRIYVEKIRARLPEHGLESVVFDDPRALPDADLYWDPRTGGGRAPTPALAETGRPLVATLHDVAHLSLPWREFYPDWRAAASGWFDSLAVRRDWRRYQRRLARVIVPSQVTRDEARRFLGLNDDLFSVIPHGVDQALFSRPAEAPASPEAPYFLHISQYQPRKNVGRLLAAHQSLPAAGRPRLVMKLIGYGGPRGQAGVEYLDGILPGETIAALYRHALAFVFPSVNEGFGLPVLEAMASGCPVITSRATACAEVAGDAALLVDPYDPADLARALTAVAEDPALRADLARRGRERLGAFDWNESADAHARVFLQVLDGR